MDLSLKLPNSKNCFACGLENPDGLKLEMYADQQGGVVCDYTIPKKFEGYPGIAHGGIVASLLDEVISRVYMVGDHNRFMYTAKLTSRFRKHVPVEEPLHMTGSFIKDRGRTAEAEAKILGPDGDLLAEGEALLIALPPEDMTAADLKELGWRVYPDIQAQT
ncbi:MAG: PaaI family thioesterase [Anaerolineales bacterium]